VAQPLMSQSAVNRDSTSKRQGVRRTKAGCRKPKGSGF
jgi:hypothetical protein